MKYLNGRVVPVVIGAALVVSGLDVATYATNGHPVLLGRSSSESKTATVSNSGKGPALRLQSGKGSPALAVSSSKLVKNLNADTVDGLPGRSLQNNVVRYVVPASAPLPVIFSLQGVQEGRYMASFNVAASTSVTTPMACYLGDATIPAQVVGYGASNGSFAASSATGVFTKHAGQAAVFGCASATATLTADQFVSTVTLTPIDHLTRGRNGTASRGVWHTGALTR